MNNRQKVLNHWLAVPGNLRIKMTKWNKESVFSEIDDLIGEITSLMQQPRFCAEHTRWVVNTGRFLEEVFGEKSPYFITFSSYSWSESGSFIVGGPWDVEGLQNPQKAIQRKHQEAYVLQLDSAKGLLLAARDELERSEIEAVYQGKDTPAESSEILRILNLAERKLRKVIRTQPSEEKEVQDAFENLLIGADIPYSREADSIEYSSKTYIPDFTMPKLNLALEIKLCGNSKREKSIIPEINDDILAYQTKYRNIFFVVYDNGFIRDVDRFIDSFEQNENVIVKVVKN
ncbi:MAG: hypothetical protein HQ542_13160 [Bacteroidia bacterium]|nr:hypothetical protein [Bacteroidia bacterium]